MIGAGKGLGWNKKSNPLSVKEKGFSNWEIESAVKFLLVDYNFKLFLKF